MHYGSRRRGKKGAENLFEEIMDQHFPNLRKKTDIQFHETQKISKGWALRSPHQNTLKSNCQIKGQKEIWKQQQKSLSHTGSLHETINRSLSRNLEDHKAVGWDIQNAERQKNVKQEYYV